MQIVIGGAAGFDDVPELAGMAGRHDIAFAPDDAALARHLPTAEVFVSWTFRGSGLARHWPLAHRLRWVHWCGAGVRPALFPELVASDVVLTNARGVFDRAMAEYVLGTVLAFVLRLPEALEEQRAGRWTYRHSERLDGTTAVVFGVGGIGRRVGELLAAAGVTVHGVGRTARDTDTVFGRVHGRDDRFALVGQADWVVAVLPDTPDTEGYFGAAEFAAMRSTARFVNVGRGSTVVEPELVEALRTGRIAGAALDVFAEEPLPRDSALWTLPGVIVTPHVSGDYRGFEDDLCRQFLDLLARYEAGAPLENVVDKQAGYVATS
ncbi:D-2-hydroxyacid dehydrogenase [Actinomycetospora lutea]|uniref:D-2-hydroxyacid dehydrogenase n=1 Tax=Actinomycetospora lutea TaxID=663604 RepID=UPI002367270D|nr:D-2-hydroxyacid dehydrogenase [Actinomycetospora lutea]MDD7939148.1 D-2-hydroxyacid dehydrogenase [Actinomycetospora lutea]